MIRTLLIFAFAIFSFSVSAQTPDNKELKIIEPVQEPDRAQEPSIFVMVEEMPSWEGCDTLQNQNEIEDCAQEQFREYIKQNLRYPAACAEMGIEGNVYIWCVIEADGSISNVELARGVNKSLDKEAMRLIREMPKWNPGKQRGKAIRVKYTFPVRFKLDR